MQLPRPVYSFFLTSRRWLGRALLLGAGVVLGAVALRPAGADPEATARGYNRFREILTHIDREYADTVDTEALSDYAVNQMLEKLDPHSVYIPAKDRARVDAFLQSESDGVGIEFNLFRDTMTVVAPLSGGPAELAGIRPGDQILAVGGRRVAGAHLSNSALAELLRGPQGSTLALEVRRRRLRQLLRIVLTRSKLPSNSVDISCLIDAETGYIKISRFAANTYDEFKIALADLRRQGLSRLVLDLRGNPGGYLDRATRVADEFIAGSRKIVSTRGRDEQFNTEVYARETGEFEEGNLVVLIDEGSASAAEVLAGALQDHDRALLVGRRSFGKGLVQQPISLADGGELRLTIARYYTPVGRSIQKPYGRDYAEYSRELSGRLERGELTEADSNRVAQGRRFRTDHGRSVYGGGGIMPDVFVPRDSLAHSAYYARLQGAGVLRAFALAFYQGHRAELEGLRPDQFARTFVVSEAQLAALAEAGRQAGVAPDAAAARRCAPLLRNVLKANIARSAYGPVAYYAVLREQDAELLRGIKLVQDSVAMRLR